MCVLHSKRPFNEIFCNLKSERLICADHKIWKKQSYSANIEMKLSDQMHKLYDSLKSMIFIKIYFFKVTYRRRMKYN